MYMLRSISLNNVLIILFYRRAHNLKITNEYIYCNVVITINVPIEIKNHQLYNLYIYFTKNNKIK